MFFTFVWSSPEYNIAEHIPLEAMCSSIGEKFGENDILNIVFLDGIEYVSQDYLNNLRRSNVNIINYEESFKRIKEKYKVVFEYYSNFESYCFLRWICLKEIANAANLEQVWHVDSDVVFHVPLGQIAKDTSGKTFMLQGCPVLVSIKKMSWFDVYENHLNELLSDPVKYSNVAQKAKPGNKLHDRALCNQSLYRNPIGSDQDLLQYLIGINLLPQDDAPKIFAQTFFYVQNPLQLNDWQEYQGQVCSGDFVSIDKKIKVNDRFLSFTHFQGNFVTYCNLFYYLHRFKCPDFLKRYVLSYSIRDEEFKISAAAYFFRVLINRTGLALSRAKLIKKFTDDDNRYLLKMMNFLAKNELK